MKQIVNKIIKIINIPNNYYSKLFDDGKKIKRIFYILPSNIYLLLFFIILFFTLFPKILTNDTAIYANDDLTKNTGEIIDKSYEQKIKTKHVKKIDYLDVLFLTYMRKNNAEYKIEVYENDKVFYSKKILAKELEDAKYKTFNINKKIKENATYKFKIIPLKAEKGNAVAISMTSNLKSLGYRIRKKSQFSKDVLVLCFIFLIVFFIINYLINSKKIKGEYNFLLLMLIYIVPILFLIPPYQVPDEPFHYHKAFRLSQYNLSKSPYENMLKRKLHVPYKMECLNYSHIQEENNVINKKDIYKCAKSRKIKKQKVIPSTTNKNIPYLFCALGIKIAMIFTSSPVIIFYMGRIFNLVLSLLIILYAIKIIPRHKKIILTIALIPVFIQQMLSYSYDSMLNSLCILIISYIIKFYYDKKINKKDFIIYLISSIIIFDIKSPYVLVSTPILFMDYKYFGKKKIDKYKKIGLLFIIIIISYFSFKYISQIGSPTPTKKVVVDDLRGNSISSLFNIRHLYHVVHDTLKYKFHEYVESFIGDLGWLTVNLSKILKYVYWFFIILILFGEEKIKSIKNKDKYINIIINIILIGGIFLSMYLLWTARGSTIIDGVQGRYLIAPVTFILLMLIPKVRKIILSNEFYYSFYNITTYVYLISLLYLYY